MVSTGGVEVLRPTNNTFSSIVSTGGVESLRFGDDACCQMLLTAGSTGGVELLRFGSRNRSLILGTGGADLLRLGGPNCCLVLSKVELSKISGLTTLMRESFGLKLPIFDLKLPVLDLDTSKTVAKMETCLPSASFPWALEEPLEDLVGWNSDHGEVIRKDRLLEGKALLGAPIPRVGEDLLVIFSMLKNEVVGTGDVGDLLSLIKQHYLGEYYYLPCLMTTGHLPLLFRGGEF